MNAILSVGKCESGSIVSLQIRSYTSDNVRRIIEKREQDRM